MLVCVCLLAIKVLENVKICLKYLFALRTYSKYYCLSRRMHILQITTRIFSYKWRNENNFLQAQKFLWIIPKMKKKKKLVQPTIKRHTTLSHTCHCIHTYRCTNIFAVYNSNLLSSGRKKSIYFSKYVIVVFAPPCSRTTMLVLGICGLPF